MIEVGGIRFKIEVGLGSSIAKVQSFEKALNRLNKAGGGGGRRGGAAGDRIDQEIEGVFKARQKVRERYYKQQQQEWKEQQKKEQQFLAQQSRIRQQSLDGLGRQRQAAFLKYENQNLGMRKRLGSQLVQVEKSLARAESQVVDQSTRDIVNKMHVRSNQLRRQLQTVDAIFANSGVSPHLKNQAAGLAIGGFDKGVREIQEYGQKVAQQFKNTSSIRRQASREEVANLKAVSAAQQVAIAGYDRIGQTAKKYAGVQAGGPGKQFMAQAADQQRRAKLALDMFSSVGQSSSAPAPLRAEAASALAKTVQQNAANARAALQNAKQAEMAAKSTAQFSTAAVASVGAFFAAMGAAKVGGIIKDMTLLAGRVESLDIVMRNIGANAGYTDGQLTLLETRVKGLGITTSVARESIARLAAQEMDLAQAARLARLAQDAAIVSGVNSSEAFEKITIAVQRLDTRMLRNQGILINLRNEYQKYARANGRVAENLSATEKQQIALNATLRVGARLAGNYEAAMTSAFKQFTSMERFREEAARVVGEQYQAIFGEAVKEVTAFLENIVKADAATQAFYASMLAGTAVAAAFTAAIGALAVAFTIIGGPITLGVLGLAAAVGVLAGASVNASAKARVLELSLKRAFTEGEAAAAQASQLNKYAAIIRELGSRAGRTADENTRLNEAFESMLILLPKLEGQIRKVRAERGDLAALEFAKQNTADLQTTSKQRVDALTNELNQTRELLATQESILQTELDRFKGMRSEGAIYEVQTATEISARQSINELRAKEARLNGQIIGEQQEQNNLILTELNILDKAAEQAQELADEVKGTFKTVRKSLVSDEAMSAFNDFIDMQNKLSKNVESEEQIRQRISLQTDSEHKQLERNFAVVEKQLNLELERAKAGGDVFEIKIAEDKIQDNLNRKAAENAKINERSAIQLENDLVRRKSILDALKQTKDILDIVLGKLRNETGIMEKVFDLRKAGVGQEVADLVVEFDRIQQEYELAIADFAKAKEEQVAIAKEAFAEINGVGGLDFADDYVDGMMKANDEASRMVRRKLIADLRQRADLEVDAAKAKNLRMAADSLEILNNLDDANRESLRRREAMERAYALRVVDEMKSMVDSTSDEYERLTDERRKILGQEERATVESIRRQIDERKKAEEDVTDFIRGLRADLQNDEAEGFTNLQNLYDRFLDNINNASLQQLGTIETLVDQSFAREVRNSDEKIKGLREKLIGANAALSKAVVDSQVAGQGYINSGMSEQQARQQVILEMGQQYQQLLQEQAVAQQELNTAVSGQTTLEESSQNFQTELTNQIRQRQALIQNGLIPTMQSLHQQEIAYQQQELANNDRETSQLQEHYRLEHERLRVVLERLNAEAQARGEQPIEIPAAAPIGGPPVGGGAGGAGAGVPGAGGGHAPAGGAGAIPAGPVGAGVVGGLPGAPGQQPPAGAVPRVTPTDASRAIANARREFAKLKRESEKLPTTAFANMQSEYLRLESGFLSDTREGNVSRWDSKFRTFFEKWRSIISKYANRKQPVTKTPDWLQPTGDRSPAPGGARQLSPLPPGDYSQNPLATNPFDGVGGGLVGAGDRAAAAAEANQSSIMDVLSVIEGAFNSLAESMVGGKQNLSDVKTRVKSSSDRFKRQMETIK